MIPHVRCKWRVMVWLRRVISRLAHDENKLVWIPGTEVERRVYAALILAGRPVTNGELAVLMRCSKSQASKDIASLRGQVHKLRLGREVRISLPNHLY